MAHFAEIDDTNKVLRVIVISNEVIENAPALENESLGIEFCKSLYGQNTNWVQTSYSGSFRDRFAGIGYIYDPILDTFIEVTNENISE